LPVIEPLSVGMMGVFKSAGKRLAHQCRTKYVHQVGYLRSCSISKRPWYSYRD
jgi:hypothetical protein